MTPIPRLLLDASVWIAAAGSPTGGSALVLALCRSRKARAVATRLIFLEAERNIQGKLAQDALLRFYHEIAALDIQLVDPATREEIAAASRHVGPKDAHVLAAALKAGVDFLLTLDRKHLMSPPVLAAGLAFQTLTPGDFLKRET